MANLKLVNKNSKNDGKVTHVKIINVTMMRRQRNYLLLLAVIEFLLILGLLNG